MKKIQSALIRITKCFSISSVLLILAGCTTLIAHNSIDPYMSSKQKRDELEKIAEQYCQTKQSLSGNIQSVIMPDYLFTTDGCSRWLDESWVSCCIVHDIIYWCGGSDEDREEADQFIKQCVNQKASLIGGLMYPAVRVGGSPWLPTPWRWGYGWKEWPKGYQKTNHHDIKNILKKQYILEKIEEQLK